MKGAVQGAATATARTPVKKAPKGPERCVRPSPKVIVPTSKTPDKFRPTAKINSAKPRHRDGLLQLEAPAHGRAALAQQHDDDTEYQEAQDRAGTIGESLRALAS